MKNIAIFLTVLFFFGGSALVADTTGPIDISSANAAISGFPGPYATVTVTTPTLNSNMATITFTSNTVGANIYLMGDGGTADVNVNATTWTLGTITGTNAGMNFTPGPYSNGGSGNVDGFGVLNQTINSFDGFTHSSDTISFTLTDTSGTWADAASVLVANANGAFAAIHVFVTPLPADGHGTGALATGFAANGGAMSVPEPATWVSLGSILGMGALLSLKRRYTLSKELA